MTGPMRARVAERFVARYGVDVLREIIAAWGRGESDGSIASRLGLGVTRQRVQQWRQVFGREVRTWEVYPEVRAAADGPGPKPSVVLESVDAAPGSQP